MALDPTADLALGADPRLAGGARTADLERRLRSAELSRAFMRGREAVVAATGALASGAGALIDLPGSYGPELKFSALPVNSRIIIAASVELRNPAASVDPQVWLLALGAVGADDASSVDLGAGPVPGIAGQILGAGGFWMNAFNGVAAVPGSSAGTTFGGGLLILRSRTPDVTLTLKYGTTGAGGLGNSEWRNRRLWAAAFVPA